MKPWYTIKASAEKAEIWIYEMIGEDFWSGGGTTAKNFLEALKGITAQQIDLHINSPGGDVFDGITIYNLLKQHKANVTTYIDGLAASIASVIALAGNKVVMAGNALFMIHNPWGVTQGDSETMRKYADVLDKVRDAILNAYSQRTALTDDELKALMDAETWMTAAEAKEYGFIDEIAEEMDMAACASFVPAMQKIGFKNIPEIGKGAEPVNLITQTTTAPTKAEKAEDTAMNDEEKRALLAQVRAESRKEAEEIVNLAVQYGCADKAAEWILAGKTKDEVARLILDVSTARAATAQVVMTPKEAKSYFYADAIRAALSFREGKRLSNFATEVSDEIAGKMPSSYTPRGGVFIPYRIQATGLTSKDATAGAEFIYTQYGGELIELLRNMSVCVRLGARVLPGLTGPLSWPRQTAGSAAVWAAENAGSDTAESDATFDTVSLAAKTLLTTTAFSRQLMNMAVVDVEAVVRQDLAQALALAWDKAGIHGTGATNNPTGIYKATGPNAVAMGGVPTFGKLVDMITECAKDNALLSNLGFVTTPGMAGKMMQTLVASSAGSNMIWTGSIIEGLMNGHKAIASNQISAVMNASDVSGGTSHGLVFGSWDQLLIGLFGPGVEIIVDPYAKKKQALIEVTGFQMADIAIRHGEAFCKATGATIS